LNELVSLSLLLQDAVMLFIVIDPVTLAVYLATKGAGGDGLVSREVIKVSVTAATAILLLFAVLGDFIMRYFSISVEDFMIALGAMLVTFSIMDFLGITPYGTAAYVKDYAVVPIATPLIAGPAAISTVIYVKYAHGLINSLASIAINMTLTYVVLRYSMGISKLLGRTWSTLIDKVVTLILIALGISLIRRGVLSLVEAVG